MTIINIAFDLDGVLVDPMPAFNRIIWEEYKSVQVPANSFEVKTEPFLDNITIDNCIERAMFCIDEIVIMPGASELLERLYELSGVPVKIITARSPKRLANVTHKLVGERLCKVPYDLTLTSKYSKVLFLNQYTFMVEDRRRTAREIAAAGKKCYLVDAVYNQMEDHPLIKRISGVHELIYCAEEFIKYD